MKVSEFSDGWVVMHCDGQWRDHVRHEVIVRESLDDALRERKLAEIPGEVWRVYELREVEL